MSEQGVRNFEICFTASGTQKLPRAEWVPQKIISLRFVGMFV